MMPVDDETHPVWMRLRHPGHGECVAWPGRRHGHRPPSCVQDPQRPALPIPVSWKSVAYRLLHGPPMLFTAPGKLSRPACPVRHAVLSGSRGVYHDGELYAAGDFTGPSPVRASNPKASRRVWLGPTRRRMRTWLSGTVSPLSGLLVTLQYLASLITPESKTLRSCLSSGSESCSDWMALSPEILLLTSRRRRGRSINRSFCESSCGVVAASQTGSGCTSPLLD